MKKIINKRMTAVILALIMTCALMSQAFAAYENPTFTDVPKGTYYYTYVEQAVEKGWISGYGDGRFGPNDNVTAGQMAIMLVRAYFADDLAAYTGPKSPYYAPYCNVAANKGILKGTILENNYTNATVVGQHLTRYGMAQMLYNTMVATGKQLPTEEQLADAKANTADWNSIPVAYREAVAACKAMKVINGIDSKGTFSGSGKMTRAQAAIVLVNIDKVPYGSGTVTPEEPGPVIPEEPKKPEEITRSPFAFASSTETVNNMMSRLNAEAPTYTEGYLSNGKPITEANILEMIEAAKVSMPEMTTWDTNTKYDYYTRFFPGYGAMGGCGSFGAGFSDYIFGKNAPITRHQNFDRVKIGDVIWMNEDVDRNGTGSSHIIVVIGFGTDVMGDQYLIYVSGNSSKMVGWGGKVYFSNTTRLNPDTSYIYSRY